MLRRASNVRVEHRGFWIFQVHRVWIGQRVALRFNRSAFLRLRAGYEVDGAAALGEIDGRTLWWADDGYFWSDDGLDPVDVALLAWDRRRRNDTRLERLR